MVPSTGEAPGVDEAVAQFVVPRRAGQSLERLLPALGGLVPQRRRSCDDGDRSSFSRRRLSLEPLSVCWGCRGMGQDCCCGDGGRLPIVFRMTGYRTRRWRTHTRGSAATGNSDAAMLMPSASFAVRTTSARNRSCCDRPAHARSMDVDNVLQEVYVEYAHSVAATLPAEVCPSRLRFA